MIKSELQERTRIQELEALVDSLQKNVTEFQEIVTEKDQLIATLTEQLRLARHLRFARKSEQNNPHQMGIFDEAELPSPEIEESNESEVTIKEHKRVRNVLHHLLIVTQAAFHDKVLHDHM